MWTSQIYLSRLYRSAAGKPWTREEVLKLLFLIINNNGFTFEESAYAKQFPDRTPASSRNAKDRVKTHFKKRLGDKDATNVAILKEIANFVLDKSESESELEIDPNLLWNDLERIHPSLPELEPNIVDLLNEINDADRSF